MQASAHSSLLVVNQGDGTLSVVDPVANRQVAAIAEGVPSMVAHEVAASPGGRLAYLPLYSDVGIGLPGTDGNLMLVVDLEKRQVVDRFDFGRGMRPHCILHEPVSRLLYMTTEVDNSITIVDPRTLQTVGSVPTHQEQSHMLAISHDGRRGYTANVDPGTVSVLDLVNRTFIKIIPIAPITQRISISNDDSMVFTSDQTTPRMAVIDTSRNEIETWIDLPAPGYGSASTTDGRLLLVTLPTAHALAVVDLNTMKTVRTLEIGPRPQQVLVRPDGAVAYVACYGGHQVAALDLSSWQITAMIDVGQKADGMAWAGN